MFSVIIPLYNKAPYILRALDSIFAQTFQDFEVIVINDGSTDGGEELVDKRYGDRLQLFHQKNSGVSIARNRGVDRAQGEYVAFLDADDAWHPQYLAVMEQFILSYPGFKIFGTSYSLKPIPTSTSNTLLKPKIFNHYFKEAIRNTFFFTSATVFAKEVFLNDLKFDSNLSLGEDLDVLFRAILTNGEALYYPVPMVYYGQEDQSSEVNKAHPIKNTLLSKIYQYESFESIEIQDLKLWEEFKVFRDKWVLFNLYHFINDHTGEIPSILNSMSHNYLLVQVFYRLPYSFQKIILSSQLLSSFLRKYMKFCFRFIYN